MRTKLINAIEKNLIKRFEFHKDINYLNVTKEYAYKQIIIALEEYNSIQLLVIFITITIIPITCKF